MDKKQRPIMHKRICACLVAGLLLLTLGVRNDVPNAKVTETVTKHAIAIAFDNSGTMYNSAAWCQAIYAVEVFASMMNEGDVLEVFPMNEVEIGGKTYTYNNPYILEGGEDASPIEQMRTTHPKGDTYTVYASITKAQESLEKKNSEEYPEKWLILMTDGTEFNKDENGNYKSISGTALRDRLTADFTAYNAIQGETAYYMGINLNDQSSVPILIGENGISNSDGTIQSSGLPDKLALLCNRIFGRDEIPSTHYTEKKPTQYKFNVDIPLSQIIVLAQGENISKITVSSKNKDVPSSVTRKLQYSQAGIKNANPAVDKSLQGQIAIFTGLEKGDYQVDIEGNSNPNVKIYYKPDADLRVDLVDATGVSSLGRKVLYNGDYEIQYALTDSKGNDLPESDMLGNLEYKIVVKHNGEELSQPVKNEAGAIPVTLKSGDTIGCDYAEVRFLKNYTVHKDGNTLGFPENGFNVKEQTNFLELTLSGGEGSYQLSELEEKGVYNLAAKYNGTPLTAEQLKNLSLDISIIGGRGDGNPICVVNQEGDQELLKLQYNQDAAHTNTGKQKLSIMATYVDKFGEETTTGTAEEFTIKDDARTLKAKIATAKNYYLLSELDGDTPIIVHVTVDGQKLSQTEMDAIIKNGGLQLQAENGLNLDTTIVPDYENSDFLVQVLKNATEKGNHKVTCDVSMGNIRNLKIEPASAKGRVKIQELPTWQIVLIILAILLLLGLLIWFIMTRRVLPLKITADGSSNFSKNGKVVPNALPQVSYGGVNRVIRLFTPKETNLQVTLPKIAGSPLAVSYSFTVKAYARVLDLVKHMFSRTTPLRCIIVFKNSRNEKIQKININGTIFSYDKRQGAFMGPAGDKIEQKEVFVSDRKSILIEAIMADSESQKRVAGDIKLRMKW